MCFQNFLFAAKTLDQIAKENKNTQNTKKEKSSTYYNYLDAVHYDLQEKVIDIVPPFQETSIGSAELMKASQESINFFKKAVETEKEPYIIQTPQKALTAWAKVKEISEQNPFIKIADKRISEWKAGSRKLEAHKNSFQKVLKLVTGNTISANQKNVLLINHLKEYGTAFGTKEILDIVNLQKDEKTDKDPNFIKTVETIRIQRCNKGVELDCYEYGLAAEDEETQISFLNKACELKYKPACSKKNHTTENIEKKNKDRDEATEEKSNKREIKKKIFEKLTEEVIGVIPPFVKENIDSDKLMNAGKKSISLFEDALRAEKDPNVITDQRKVIKCWEDVEKNQEQNPFIEIATNRLDEWVNANERLIAHQESFQKVKQLVKSNDFAVKQKKLIMLMHLKEFGIEFGVAEILNVAEDAELNRTVAEQDFQDLMYHIKSQRCDKGISKDCSVDWFSKSSAKMTVTKAANYCKELSNENNEWRLPTISELRTLVQNCKNTEADGACGVTDNCLSSDCWSKKLCTNTSKFSLFTFNSKSSCSKLGDTDDLWSSSNMDNKCWYIDFTNGDIHKASCTSKKHVRCIKNNQETQ